MSQHLPQGILLLEIWGKTGVRGLFLKSLAKPCLHLSLSERTHGFFLRSCPLPSPAKERCASRQGIMPSAEGRGVGEKDALRRVCCIRTTQPQTTPSPQKAPPAISKPTCHKHLRWLFSCLAVNVFFMKARLQFPFTLP